MTAPRRHSRLALVAFLAGAVATAGCEGAAGLGMDAGAELAGDAEGPDAPADMPGVDSFLLSGIPLGAQGRSQLLSLQLPADAVSFTVVILGRGDGVTGRRTASYLVDRLVSPDGKLLVSDEPEGVDLEEARRAIPFAGQFFSPNRSVLGRPGVGTLLVPSSRDVELVPGQWQFRVAGVEPDGSPAGGVVDVRLLIKRAAVRPEAGRLDVHLHLSGARGWTAATAESDAPLQAAIERMRAVFAAADISLGRITYDDLPADHARVDLSDPRDPLGDLYGTSADGTGVNLFLLDAFSGPYGDQIAGLSGGTPGALLLPGTPASGVAIHTRTEFTTDPRALGTVMAHEAAHFLGLFHTTELALEGEDPLADTASGEAGSDNLMYPITGHGTLSAEQRWVLLGSPAIVSL